VPSAPVGGATFALRLRSSFQCGRCVVISGKGAALRDVAIMGTRSAHHDPASICVACAGLPSIYISQRRSEPLDNGRSFARLRAPGCGADRCQFDLRLIVKCSEVAFLYDRVCLPSTRSTMINSTNRRVIAFSTSQGPVIARMRPTLDMAR